MIGEQFARTLGMLRITLPKASESGVIVLEGRLTRLWAQVLLRVARGENQPHGNTFDLKEVSYVDSAGEDALRTLCGAYEASFIAESAYGNYLCKRLKLRRASIVDVENINRRLEESYPAPLIREVALANEDDPPIYVDEKQHPSRCGE
jgi:hypothetical protein